MHLSPFIAPYYLESRLGEVWCHIRVKRLDGETQEFQSQRAYATKEEARRATAALAMRMGALSFLRNEVPPSHSVRVEEPILTDINRATASSSTPEDASADESDDSTESDSTTNTYSVADSDGSAEENLERNSKSSPSLLRAIKDCCISWRPAHIKPEWFPFAAEEGPSLPPRGMALRIKVSPHSWRCYSTDATYSTESKALSACAANAHKAGVLGFIKYGNGQRQPSGTNARPLAPDKSLKFFSSGEGVSLRLFLQRTVETITSDGIRLKLDVPDCNLNAVIYQQFNDTWDCACAKGAAMAIQYFFPLNSRYNCMIP
jgi:hypothetical protein